MNPVAKMVKTQSKGMVTIPIEFRRELGIESNSLMEARLTEEGVLFVKVDLEPVELYSDDQIQQWVEEDRLSSETVAKLNKLLKK